MSRTALLALLGSLTFFAFSPTNALASGSSAACTESGGTYTKDGPNSICVYPEQNVGNAPDHSNSQTTQDTTTGQGNLGNKPVSACTGPKGQCK
jgi:hypothetical protein